MRRLSSSFDATRIWRSIERAILEKKPSIKLSQEPCFGVNTKAKRPSGWVATHRTVVQRCHRPKPYRPARTALHGVMGHTDPGADRRGGWLRTVSQQDAGPLHPAGRLRARSRNYLQPRQIIRSNRQLNDTPRCCHGRLPITDQPHYTLCRDRGNPVGYGRNQGIDVLGTRSHLIELLPHFRSDRIHRPGDGTCSGRLVSLSARTRDLIPPYALAAALLAMNALPLASIRCRTTASFRANATFALRIPARFATRTAQLFSDEPLTGLVKMTLAAS
jgi:hypothetical protein